MNIIQPKVSSIQYNIIKLLLLLCNTYALVNHHWYVIGH